MGFRFPISPSFSITGQPIGRLISGDIPADYDERIQLLDAIIDKFASIHEGHAKAREMALASQGGGPGFTLYLRNFGIEQFKHSGDPTDRMHNLRIAQFEKMISEQVKRDGSFLLSLRGGNDVLDEFLGRGEPIFTAQSGNWHALAAELIQAAKVIVIFTSAITPGLFEEIEIIQSLGKTVRTIVYISSAAAEPAGMIFNQGDPGLLAILKSHFLQFENVYELPLPEGWQPSLAEQDSATWPGALQLSKLLTDSYVGTGELKTIRTVPCQILGESELQSADHKAALEYLLSSIAKFRKDLRSLHLKAPLSKRIIGTADASTYIPLRLVYSSFGVAAAFEDYANMIESLAILSEIYTYWLLDPLAGSNHAEYALQLLAMRYYDSIREQDLPDRTLNDYSYAQEQLGNVYYGLARFRRALDQPNEALAAFEAAVAIREPLETLSARKGVAATLHSMAGLLHNYGQNEKAKVLIERAIALKQEIYGVEPNEEVAASLHNHASILLNMGDLESAEAVLHQCLEMKKIVFGTTHHVSVAETSILVALFLIKSGERDDAVPILRFVQSIYKDLAPESAELTQVEDFLAAEDSGD